MDEEKNLNEVEVVKTASEVEDKIIKLRPSRAWYWPLVAWVAFAGVWFWAAQNLSPEDFKTAQSIGNDTIADIFKNYGAYFGLIFGLLSLIITYILFLLAKLCRIIRFKPTKFIIIILTFSPWLLAGRQLVYFEPKRVDIAKALIAYCGWPLIYAGATVGVLTLLAIIFIFLRKFLPKRGLATKAVKVSALLVVMPIFLTGCVGTWMEYICGFMSDSDHCYQASAIQEGQVEECEKIKGERFKSGGSNPPRDKCYLQIAESTGDTSSCDQIKGGLMSYTREECLTSVAKLFEDPSACSKLSGAAATKCKADLNAVLTPEKVIALDDQIDTIKNELKNGSDKDLEAQLKGLEAKRQATLGIFNKEKTAEYEKLKDPITQEIIGDWAIGDLDSASKNKLLAFNDKLKKQGLKMTPEQYQAFKDYYQFTSDPANDIEKMNDDQIVKNRWNEKVGNVVDSLKIWKTKTTKEEEGQDEQLRFYERMLERQAAISQKMSELDQDVDRNVGILSDAVKDKVTDEVKDKVIETIFGEITKDTVGWATKPIEEALGTVQSEAKSMEFRGLVGAYNQGMVDEIGKFKGDVEKAHAEVIKNLQTDAYHYAEGNSFAKYGNLLENKDCDGSNPHCINRDVFWKAMKKSYKYQHQS